MQINRRTFLVVTGTPERCKAFIACSGLQPQNSHATPVAGILYLNFEFDSKIRERIWSLYRNIFGHCPISWREYSQFRPKDVDAAEYLLLRVDMREVSRIECAAPEEYVEERWDIPVPCVSLEVPILARSGSLPKSPGLSHTTLGEILFHETIGGLFTGTGGLPPSRPVHDQSGDATGWHQLVPDRVFCKFTDATTGWEPNTEHPQFGNRDVLFDDLHAGEHLIAQVRIDQLDKPLLATWELFGDVIRRGSNFVPPLPRIVVSQEIRRELKSAKVRGLVFTPIDSRS